MKKILNYLIFLTGVVIFSALLYLFLLDELIMPYIVDVPRVRVPQLRGRSLPQAGLILQKWGLHLATGDSIYHETLPAGAVVNQDPAAGDRIKKGRRVTVDISLGPRFYAVPDSIVRVSLREARLQLEDSQLVLGEITYVSSEAIPEGAVLRATPPSGTLLPRGTPVDLEISNGPSARPKHIPSLLGLSIEQVEDSLRKYEMRLGKISNRVDNGHPVGTILSQSPAPPKLALPLTPVDLVLSVRETVAVVRDTALVDTVRPGGKTP